MFINSLSIYLLSISFLVLFSSCYHGYRSNNLFAMSKLKIKSSLLKHHDDVKIPLDLDDILPPIDPSDPNYLPIIEWYRKPIASAVGVPPTSLCSEFNVSSDRLPTIPEDCLKGLQGDDVVLPIVRVEGVERTIELLAEILNCAEYKHSLIQFWFLDIVTDCLWRLQDEFLMPQSMQKVAISWILVFIDIIRDTEKKLSKHAAFEVMREAVTIAGEYINEGDPRLPSVNDLVDFLTPEDLWERNIQEDDGGDVEQEHVATEAKKDSSSLEEQDMSKENQDSDDELEYLDVEIDNEKHLYVLEEGETCSEISDSEDSTFSVCSCELRQLEYEDTTDSSSIQVDATKKDAGEVNDDDAEIVENRKIAKNSTKTMLAIIDFIFEYFHSDFQYFLVKNALINQPNYVKQDLNYEWNYPKLPRPPDPVVKDDKPVKNAKKDKVPAQVTSDDLLTEEQKQDKEAYKIASKKVEDNKLYIFPLVKATSPEFFEELFPPPPPKSNGDAVGKKGKK